MACVVFSFTMFLVCLIKHRRFLMPTTTSTDGESFAVLVGNAIKHLNLVPKIVGITSDSGTNLTI